jgi:hypothetical protein
VGAGNGCSHGNASGFQIGFIFADYLGSRFLIGFFVHHAHSRTEFHSAALHFADVNPIGAADIGFQFQHTAFDKALGLAGGMVFGVFRQIAMRARSGNRFDNSGTLGEVARSIEINLVSKPGILSREILRFPSTSQTYV